MQATRYLTTAIAAAAISLGGYSAPCGTHCGTERWPVKTLTDADRAKVDLTPVSSTVDHLRTLAAPAQRPDSARVAPTELTTFEIHGVLIGWKLEGDRDMHLVIADPATPTKTMIVEVPSTTCDHVCSSSGHVTEFRIARKDLIAKFGTPTSAYHKFPSPEPITVIGVGFFDFLHGQTGVAPNGIELHPVLRVSF